MPTCGLLPVSEEHRSYLVSIHQRRTRQRREGENSAEEIERNWFCDLWVREEDKVRGRYMKSSLIIWAPPTWCFYKNATIFIFTENENGQKLYSFFVFKFIFFNWKWIMSMKTQPNQFFGSGSHKKLKIDIENTIFFFPFN